MVIGNGDYKSISRLDNPRNDAVLMYRALSRIGFDTSLKLNASAAEFIQAIDGFLQEASEADLILIYYAGHAVQIEGENYLIPTDFVAGAATDDFVRGMIRVGELVGTIEKSGARRTIIVLDACRDNPFTGSAFVDQTPGSRGGLAVPPPILSNNAELTFLYSTAPGQIAIDGDKGNSPFTRAFALAAKVRIEPNHPMLRHVPTAAIWGKPDALSERAMRTFDPSRTP